MHSLSPALDAGLQLCSEANREEKHHRVVELAAQLGISPNTARRMFRHEPGVIVLEGDGRFTGKRGYKTLLIPESVRQRVLQRLTQQPLKVKLAPRGPRRVVFLRDRDRRVA